MGKWEALIAARDRLHFSQVEAAKRLGVGLATYQRWELGKRRPQPQHLRNLCKLFDLRSDDEPGVWSQRAADEPYGGSQGGLPPTLSASRESDWELPVLLATRLTAHLWSLALGNHATGVEKRAAIRRAIEESDCRHAGDPHYQITRREAMGTLATLPLITFDLALPGREIATAHIGDLLAYSAASLEACWELYDRGETSEILLGFQCASRYLAVLRGIGQTSPPRRQEALRLATQYALLKTLLSQYCTGTAAITQYAREAIALSKETGDIPLHLSTFTKLTWTYLYEEDHRQALIAAQDAQAALERFEQQPGGEPLPPDVRDSVQCALALAQDRNRRLSRRALAVAMECDPGSALYRYMMRPSQLWEAGRIDCTQNSYARVMEVLVMRVNRQTFLPSMSEIGQAEINLMALSSSHAHDRDLEYTLHFWQAVLKGAKVRRSDTLYALACTTCRHRRVV